MYDYYENYNIAQQAAKAGAKPKAERNIGDIKDLMESEPSPHSPYPYNATEKAPAQEEASLDVNGDGNISDDERRYNRLSKAMKDGGVVRSDGATRPFTPAEEARNNKMLKELAPKIGI